MKFQNSIKKCNKKTQQLYKEMKKTFFKMGLLKWKDLREKHIIKFINKWFRKAERNPNLKPYLVENFIIQLKNILDLKFGGIPKILANRLVTIIKRKAQIRFEQIEIKRTRAETFSLEDIKKAVSTLWKKENKISKAAAVCLAITFTTGARTIDALRVNTKRIREEETTAGKFLIMTLNTSKTNPLAKFHEQLTFKIDKRNIIKTDKWIRKWRKRFNPKGTLLGTDIKARQMVYQFKKVSKELKLKGVITGHSGRNTTLLRLFEAGVDDESKKLFMRWRANSQMPTHYRGILLETSEIGAAAILAKNKFNQNTEKQV